MKALIAALLISLVNTVVNAQLQYQDLFSSEIKQGAACFRIPALITAPNGDLLAVADERVPSCADLKSNPDINIVMRRSSDNGFTWSTIETLVDYSLGKSASDPSFIMDKITGAIFLFFNFMDLENEPDVYYLRFIKSVDNGKTWSNPIDITSQISDPGMKKDFKFITSGRGIQTSDGTLLHTMVNLQKGLFLFGSDDHGENWFFINTPIKPADESKVIELADGSLMINSRVNGAGLRYIHTSADNGKTWTSLPDSTLIDPGCNASLIRYPPDESQLLQGKLLFSNLNSKDSRSNLTIRISDDEGKSWSEGKTIYQGSSAYSSLAILSDNKIAVIFERDNYQKISLAILPFEWIVDNQNVKR